MKEYLKIIIAGVLACASIFCTAQTTSTLTGTVTDSDSQTWNNATDTFNLYNPYGTIPVVCSTGVQVPLQTVIPLDGTGTFSGTIIKNSAICPAGTTWTQSIQSNTSAPPVILPTQNITTNTYNAGAFASANIIAPRFSAAIFGAFGYNISEPLPNPCKIYNTWFDVVTLQQMTCNGTGSYVPSNSITLSTNSVNNASQTHLNFLDSSTVTWTNTGANEIATAIGGSGNPTTTNYIFASYSGLYDDNHGLSAAVPVTSYSSTGTVVTVITTSAHGFVVGDYIDAHSMTGWPNATQAPMLGSFQVIATGLTTTQFEFNYVGSISPCSSSCGNTYNADYWAIYQTANQPFINGHGTLYGREDSASGFDSNFSTELAPLCALTPGPNYLILEAGQNDLSTGIAATTIETNFSEIYAKAHAAGCLVIQGSIVAANYGGSPDGRIWANLASINQWFPQQAKSFTNISSASYFDQYIDYNSYLASRNVHLGDDSAAGYIFAQRTNEGILSKNGSAPGQFPSFFQTEAGIGINTDNFYGATPWFFYATGNTQNPCSSVNNVTCNPWMVWQNPGVTITNYGGSTTPYLQVFDTTHTSDIAQFQWGRDTGNLNNVFVGFHYDSSGASTNYGILSVAGAPNYAMKFFATGVVQLPGLAGSGTVPVNVDPSGNLSRGTAPTTPAWVSASSGLASGFWKSEACTVGGVAKTCVEEDISTGALNNASTTTVPLIETLTGGILGDPVCSDNSSRVQTGNTQPVGANFVGGTSPFTSFSVWVGATSENAECIVKGYL